MAVNDPATKLANKISDIMDSKIRKRTKKASLIKSAKVVKVDTDGMPWVSISGSDQETPVNGEILANAKVGDFVSVSIENGKCNILGNVDDPSIGSLGAKNISNYEIQNAVEQNGIVGRAINVESNRVINQLDELIDDKVENVEDAVYKLDLKNGEENRILRNKTDSSVAIAEEAKNVAEATGQHFWYDDNGVHVTEITQEEWQESMEQNDFTGHNILINSLGILIRKALTYITTWTGNAVAFFDGEGNNSSNITASFGRSGAQIGRSDNSHIEMDYRSMKLIDRNANTYVDFHDMRDANGYSTITKSITSDGVSTRINIFPMASSTNYTVTVSGSYSGTITKALSYIDFSTPPNGGATITITYTTNEDTAKAYTLGLRYPNSDIGPLSIALGNRVKALGGCSIAAGTNTEAKGENSVSFGDHTKAIRDNAVAIGKYNDPGFMGIYDWLFQVGNGSATSGNSTVFMVNTGGIYSTNSSTHHLNIVYDLDDRINYSASEISVDSDGQLFITGYSMGYSTSKFGFSLNGNITRRVYDPVDGWTSPDQFMVQSNVHSMFETDVKTKSTGSVSAGGTAWVTITVSKTGYDFIGVVGWYIDGTTMFNVYAVRGSSSTEAQVAVKNTGTTAASATVRLTCLYVKTS